MKIFLGHDEVEYYLSSKKLYLKIVIGKNSYTFWRKTIYSIWTTCFLYKEPRIKWKKTKKETINLKVLIDKTEIERLANLYPIYKSFIEDINRKKLSIGMI